MFNADSGNAGYRWQLVRLAAGRESEVTLLSREFFALTTHFVRVTLACAGDGCALCDVLPARGLFYLACMCQGRLSMLELGNFSANDLESHAKLLHGGLRPGLQFRLRRRTKRGAVFSEVIGELPGVEAVGRVLLAQRVLAMYKLPCCNPTESFERYEERIRSIVLRRNEQLAKQLLRSESRGV